MLNIGFIGAGNMAQAMIKGWSQLDEVHQVVYAPHSGQSVAENMQIDFATTAEALVKQSDLIVIATPPTHLAAVAQEINSVVTGKVIISILGGISLSTLMTHFDSSDLLVRALPNVNVAVQQGYTAMAVNPAVDDEVKGAVFGLLTVLGRVDELPETQFGAVSALAGSGPAFVAGFVQAMTQAGLAAGVQPDIAEQLAVQTAQGTLDKMVHEKLTPMALAEQVMTPGGSTAAGWDVLQTKDITALMTQVIQATMAKNAEFE
ncbi:pyrroline-5-carboxylate reductase [Weissella diestrammenae]|uniref:Pyrroline-5-carboxylate reductase n=1 Tax=Weissella diestrammenae TaxID=1162633 RepID=A0A7G9T6I9_9LACO|nr:pyrroline-5-carboxylate reductase [Weissella diestrammenae]MCM0583230.1 pyrroline-5-carboxylate reductase [Weissella diestrammenae]QNN75714.1 pyrroline-5-carboxylate reductase [Weissella diestrammenae]